MESRCEHPVVAHTVPTAINWRRMQAGPAGHRDVSGQHDVVGVEHVAPGAGLEARGRAQARAAGPHATVRGHAQGEAAPAHAAEGLVAVPPANGRSGLPVAPSNTTSVASAGGAAAGGS